MGEVMRVSPRRMASPEICACMAASAASAEAKAAVADCSSCWLTTPEGASRLARSWLVRASAAWALIWPMLLRAAANWSGRSLGRTRAMTWPFFTRSPRSTRTAST
jgi:hypothetical protein